MSHVFLSYSRSDRGLADRVREDLTARGLDVWSDRRLGLGGSWLAEISSAIDGAQAVVLLATPAALTSKWVMREVEAAQVMGKPVVPILAGECRFGDLPASLAGINGVDIADGYENAITLVAEAFVDVAEQSPSVKTATAPLPTLLLMTDDGAVTEVVEGIARSIGLAVVTSSQSASELLEVAAHAHVAVIDGRFLDESGFVAGYVAGRGGKVVWLTDASSWLRRVGVGIRFCSLNAVDLEREICGAAFLPRRAPG